MHIVHQWRYEVDFGAHEVGVHTSWKLHIRPCQLRYFLHTQCTIFYQIENITDFFIVNSP